MHNKLLTFLIDDDEIFVIDALVPVNDVIYALVPVKFDTIRLLILYFIK